MFNLTNALNEIMGHWLVAYTESGAWFPSTDTNFCTNDLLDHVLHYKLYEEQTIAYNFNTFKTPEFCWPSI